MGGCLPMVYAATLKVVTLSVSTRYAGLRRGIGTYLAAICSYRQSAFQRAPRVQRAFYSASQRSPWFSGLVKDSIA